MDETSTSKFKNNLTKRVSYTKDIRIKSEPFFEEELRALLDKELLNPKEQILQQIFDYSKRTL